MNKKLTKSTKNWFLQNKQTYPTEQTVTDNIIKHATHSTVATAGNVWYIKKFISLWILHHNWKLILNFCLF